LRSAVTLEQHPPSDREHVVPKRRLLAKTVEPRDRVQERDLGEVLGVLAADATAKVRVEIRVVAAGQALARNRVTGSYCCNQLFVSHVVTLSLVCPVAASPADGRI